MGDDGRRSRATDSVRDADALRQAAGEHDAARRERIERLRRGSIWFGSMMLLALLVGLMIGRVVNDQIPWGGVMPQAAPRLLDVQARSDAQVFGLVLHLERPVSYRRSEQDGALSLTLQGVRLDDSPRSGRLRHGAVHMAWRVQTAGDDVQVLLVGLAGALQVRETQYEDAAGWHLLLQVPLQSGSR